MTTSIVKYKIGRYQRHADGGSLPVQHIDASIDGIMEHYGKIAVYGAHCKKIAKKIIPVLNRQRLPRKNHEQHH